MREFNPALIVLTLAIYMVSGLIINLSTETAIIQNVTGLVLFCIPSVVIASVATIWYGKSS